ncbi:hypothetical protein F5146DRAFT_1000042 [Armillaria mellea]|nr:hypothetical protein F5146DRAFT_1000042 [Armillaria mellea]
MLWIRHEILVINGNGEDPHDNINAAISLYLLNMAEASLNGTFGAFLIGIIAFSYLFGVTCTQTWYYYTRYVLEALVSTKVPLLNDPVLTDSKVGTIWILEVLHLTFRSHAIYYYVILHYGDPTAMAEVTWSVSGFFLFQSPPSDIFYAVSNYNIPLVAVLVQFILVLPARCSHLYELVLRFLATTIRGRLDRKEVVIIMHRLIRYSHPRIEALFPHALPPGTQHQMLLSSQTGLIDEDCIDDSKDWNGAHRTIHRWKTGYQYKDEANDVPTYCNTVLVILLSTKKEVAGKDRNTSSKESSQTSASGFPVNAIVQEDAVGDNNKCATVKNERQDSGQLVVYWDPGVDAVLCRSDVCTTNAHRNSNRTCDYPEPEKDEEEENVLVVVLYCRDSEEEKERRESLGEDVAYSQGDQMGIAIGNIGYCTA